MIDFEAGRRDAATLGLIRHLTIFGLLLSRTKRPRSEQPGVCRRHLQGLAGTTVPRPRALSTNTALPLSVCPSASFTNVFPPRRPAGSDLLLYHSSHLFLPRPSPTVTSPPLFSPLSSLVPSGFSRLLLSPLARHCRCHGPLF